MLDVMKTFQTLQDVPSLQDQCVLLRVDMNVPLKEGQITDTSRMDRIKPTIEYLTTRGAKVVLLSHLGRPKGQVDPDLSLKGIAASLGVKFTDAEPGSVLDSEIRQMSPGEVLLVENIRFYPGEEANDKGLAKKLSQSADLYVNDAFSVSHRAHMSVDAITQFLPSYAGLLMQEELSALDHALGRPQRPVMAIVGGAKVSTKLQILESLSHKVDLLVIGGAMANTFLLAQGYSVGKSLVELDLCSVALKILKEAPCQILLPVDVVTADKISPTAGVCTKYVQDVTEGEMILDVGPETASLIEDHLKETKTVVLNGPLGVFETPPFDQGTNRVFQKIAALTKDHMLVSIAGGGDTVVALKHAGVGDSLSYISTAGGAFLEWLEGRKLPGVEALKT